MEKKYSNASFYYCLRHIGAVPLKWQVLMAKAVMAPLVTNGKTGMRHAQDAYNEWITAKCIMYSDTIL